MGGLARRAPSPLRGALIAAGLLAASCASTPTGAVHVVRPGENVYRIARHYGVPPERVVRANRIRDVTDIAVGQRLVIPGSRREQPRYSLTPPEAVLRSVAARPGGREQALREADLRFRWPVRGKVSSRYGWRRGRKHEGIDIPARRGTPVLAAEGGRVIHSGKGLGAYGTVVIVKHSGHYTTVYAHNRRNLVRKGEFVEKGQVIGEVGSTGNASGTHLHFEIRRDRRADDPLRYLP
ncbi:MAG: M23 family metallopeptidase [Alphaproteobacteria bacterium]